MKKFSIAYNRFTGEISEVFDLPSLVFLDFSENGYLTGEIPAGLYNSENLKYLDLSGNDFEGIISSELGGLRELKFLDLHSNDFYGKIPSQFGELQDLEILQLYYNDFGGEIPPQLGELQSLEKLGLAHNDFNGEIPSELGDLESMTHLNLGGNYLEGGVPVEFSNLINLESFMLHNNALVDLPDLSSLPLTTFVVKGNNLTFEDFALNEALLLNTDNPNISYRLQNAVPVRDNWIVLDDLDAIDYLDILDPRLLRSKTIYVMTADAPFDSFYMDM